MENKFLQEAAIEVIKSEPPIMKLQQTLDSFSALQKGFYALLNSEDSRELNLLKIGTTLNLFLIDTLASGKKAENLTKKDWGRIAQKVYHYAVTEDEQRYSAFVFTLYADYLEVSVNCFHTQNNVNSKRLQDISELSRKIQEKTEKLEEGSISEPNYVEDCLWFSLEAMVKLLSLYFELKIPEDYAQLIKGASEFAFEYGRYVLYAKEQTILEGYLQNQKILDEQLQEQYDAYLEDVRIQSDKFQQLIDNAFTPALHDSLIQSAELAREAGVQKEELLTTVKEIDDFFLN